MGAFTIYAIKSALCLAEYKGENSVVIPIDLRLLFDCCSIVVR